MALHLYGRLSAVAVAFAALGACSKAPHVPECDRLKDSRDVDRCYSSAAERRQKPELCTAIVGSLSRAGCFADCGQALSRSDLCLKAEFPDSAARCLAAVARKRQDPAMCERILLPRNRDECLTEVAQAIRSFDLCSKIAHVERQFQCQKKLAQQAQNPELCAKVGSWRGRDECLLSFLSLQRSVSSEGMPSVLCERLQSPELKATCYMTAAWQDPRACEHVDDSSQSFRRLQCYRTAMEKMKTRASCSLIPDPFLVDECLVKQGTGGQIALCDALKDTVLRDGCWASATQPEMCLKIQSRPMRKQCLSKTWKQAQDPSVCNLLQGGERGECRAYLASKKGGTLTADAPYRKGR